MQIMLNGRSIVAVDYNYQIYYGHVDDYIIYQTQFNYNSLFYCNLIGYCKFINGFGVDEVDMNNLVSVNQ